MEALAVKGIILCGHTYCGAMKVVLGPASLDTLPATKGWLISAEATRRAMLVQIENLRTHPSVLTCADGNAGQYLPVAEAGHGAAERADRLSVIRQI